MSREAAGAALRALRESRQWSLTDLAAATGVSVMGLSYLERGARKPHKTTVQRVEAGLGLPTGTYSRLLASTDPSAELSHLGGRAPRDQARGGEGSGVAADVLEAYAEAHVESLRALMSRLPAETSNDYETYIRSVIAQCVKAELLAADSWRVAVKADAGADAGSAERLMLHVRSLEEIRTDLIARLPAGISTGFERACIRSGLPDSVIVGLLGINAAQVWDIRNGGAIPPHALSRVGAFVESYLSTEQR